MTCGFLATRWHRYRRQRDRQRLLDAMNVKEKELVLQDIALRRPWHWRCPCSGRQLDALDRAIRALEGP